MIQAVLVKDVFETYSYFYIDDKTKHGFLIDPGAEADRLMSIIQENSWTIEAILLTHGHFDHMGAVEELSQKLHIPYYIHENGKLYLQNVKLNLSAYCMRNVVLHQAIYFHDGEELCLKVNPKFALRVISTPGHTPDSVAFYSDADRVAFVGDTIFKGSIGSTEYPGGNNWELRDSLLHTIFCWDNDMVLLSGHSPETTVGAEKRRYGIH